MAHLALNDGKPIRNFKEDPWPRWPVWDEREANALLEVLNSGVWSYNGPKEQASNDSDDKVQLIADCHHGGRGTYKSHNGAYRQINMPGNN